LKKSVTYTVIDKMNSRPFVLESRAAINATIVGHLEGWCRAPTAVIVESRQNLNEPPIRTTVLASWIWDELRIQHHPSGLWAPGAQGHGVGGGWARICSAGGETPIARRRGCATVSCRLSRCRCAAARQALDRPMATRKRGARHGTPHSAPSTPLGRRAEAALAQPSPSREATAQAWQVVLRPQRVPR